MKKIILSVIKPIFQKLINLYKSENVLLPEWILLGAASIFPFIIFKYVDLDSLTKWTVDLLEVISNGKIRDFYLYSHMQNMGVVKHGKVGCDIFALLPWSIWNIPLWIAQRFFDIDILAGIFPVMWSKLFLVFMLLITARYTFKIGMLLTANKAKSTLMAFLTISSIHVFVGIYYAGQNDILVIAFSVAAVYYLLKDKKLMFYILSSCSIAVKPFFIFAYVAVLLIYEKNVFKLIIKTVSGCGILILCKLLYINAPLYKESLKDSSGLIKYFFEIGVNTPHGNASFFAIGIIVLYLLCYNMKKEEKDTKLFTIYAVAAAYSLMLIFGANLFYRYIYFVPFLPILLISNERTVKLNMLIIPVVDFFIVFMNIRGLGSHGGHAFIFQYRYIPETVLYKLFPKVGQLQLYKNLENLTNGIDVFYPVFSAVILAGIILILIINYPGEKTARFKVPFENEKCDRWIIWSNAFLFVLYLARFF